MRNLFKTFVNGRLRAQIVKEFLSILRDPRSRLIVFVPPLMQLLIFTFATTLEVRNANVAVYNQDAGHWSYEMEARVGAADFVNRIYTVHNRDELRRLIDQRKVIAALVMGPDFSRNIAAGGTGNLQVIVDGRRSNAGQITVGYLNAIAADVGAAARKDTPRASPVVVRHWFNPNLIYRWFVVPALSGILFTGSFWLLLPSLLLFILSVVGIGLMISAVSATQQQAILGAFAIGVPAVLMSGFATPVENMPLVLQWMAQGIPLTHFLVIVEGTFLKAMPVSDVLANTWPLAVIALVSLTLATLLVRNRLQ